MCAVIVLYKISIYIYYIHIPCDPFWSQHAHLQTSVVSLAPPAKRFFAFHVAHATPQFPGSSLVPSLLLQYILLLGGAKRASRFLFREGHASSERRSDGWSGGNQRLGNDALMWPAGVLLNYAILCERIDPRRSPGKKGESPRPIAFLRDSFRGSALERRILRASWQETRAFFLRSIRRIEISPRRAIDSLFPLLFRYSNEEKVVSEADPMFSSSHGNNITATQQILIMRGLDSTWIDNWLNYASYILFALIEEKLRAFNQLGDEVSRKPVNYLDCHSGVHLISPTIVPSGITGRVWCQVGCFHALVNDLEPIKREAVESHLIEPTGEHTSLFRLLLRCLRSIFSESPIDFAFWRSKTVAACRWGRQWRRCKVRPFYSVSIVFFVHFSKLWE